MRHQIRIVRQRSSTRWDGLERSVGKTAMTFAEMQQRDFERDELFRIMVAIGVGAMAFVPLGLAWVTGLI